MGCRAEIMFKPFVRFQSSINVVRYIKGFNSTVSVWVAVEIFSLKEKEDLLLVSWKKKIR